MARLNLQYYDGKDYYSDGIIEDEIYEIIKTKKDVNKILSRDYRWAILYHLSPIRENLINWIPFKRNGNLLEIGGGCGALTEYFCKKLKQVKVVELSKKRSMIIYERCKKYSNLEIYVGNFNNIKFHHKFDYITLIGVLEYAGSFINSKTPYIDFLKKIKNLLKKNGKLILAIENRYGLKYFAGAKEDHTAKEFDGIVGYKENKNVRTFGKKELEMLLKESGFNKQKFYYPHPDYKLPIEIFSDDFLPKIDFELHSAPNFDYDRYKLFSESLAFEGIILNEQFPFFANSFLVVCGN